MAARNFGFSSTTDEVISGLDLGGKTAVVTSFSARRLDIIDLTQDPPVITGSMTGLPFAAEDVDIGRGVLCTDRGIALITNGGGSRRVLSVNLNTRQIVSNLSQTQRRLQGFQAITSAVCAHLSVPANSQPCNCTRAGRSHPTLGVAPVRASLS